MKIDDLSAWEAFIGVALHGNFSRAAAALRIPLSQLSKRVARLEDGLGTRLFHRSTRVVALTDEGRALLPRVTAALEDLRGIESEFERQGELTGTLRIASVPFVAQRLLIPVLREYQRLHPRVQVEIDLAEDLVNLVESQTDLAVRIDEPTDSTLVYRKLVPNELVLCAAPAYLKAHPAPVRKPADLARHRLLMLAIHRECAFTGPGAPHTLADFEDRREIRCEDGAFLTELALQGGGILVRSRWDVRDHLRAGRLVELLPRAPLEAFGCLYAVVPSRRYLAPRVRAFLDLLVGFATDWK